MKHYTQEEIEAVEQLLKKARDHVMYRKFMVIHLHMKGHANTKIAEMMKLNKNTVGIYINTFNEQGAAGLVPTKQVGRPKRLTQEQEKKLYETIKTRTPDEAGFSGVMNWTAKLACRWVKREFGVQYHNNGMLALFRRLNLSYTRPTYVLAKADPAKQEKFIGDFEAAKKNYWTEA